MSGEAHCKYRVYQLLFEVKVEEFPGVAHVLFHGHMIMKKIAWVV